MSQIVDDIPTSSSKEKSRNSNRSLSRSHRSRSRSRHRHRSGSGSHYRHRSKSRESSYRHHTPSTSRLKNRLKTPDHHPSWGIFSRNEFRRKSGDRRYSNRDTSTDRRDCNESRNQSKINQKESCKDESRSRRKTSKNVPEKQGKALVIYENTDTSESSSEEKHLLKKKKTEHTTDVVSLVPAETESSEMYSLIKQVEDLKNSVRQLIASDEQIKKEIAQLIASYKQTIASDEQTKNEIATLKSTVEGLKDAFKELMPYRKIIAKIYIGECAHVVMEFLKKLDADQDLKKEFQISCSISDNELMQLTDEVTTLMAYRNLAAHRG